MDCPDCGKDMGEAHDKTYSNTGKKYPGVDPNHTGDIYKCEDCECLWLDNFITKNIEKYNG